MFGEVNRELEGNNITSYFAVENVFD